MSQTFSELILETRQLIEEARLIQTVGKLRRTKNAKAPEEVPAREEGSAEVAPVVCSAPTF